MFILKKSILSERREDPSPNTKTQINKHLKQVDPVLFNIEL